MYMYMYKYACLFSRLISQMAKWLKIIREMSETVSKNTEVSSKTSTDSVSNSTLPSSPRYIVYATTCIYADIELHLLFTMCLDQWT